MKKPALIFLLLALALAIGCGNPKTEDQLYSEIQQLQKEENLVEVTKAMEEYVERFPKGKHRTYVMNELAKLYVGSAKDFRKAVDIYKSIQDEYPDSTGLIAKCQFMTGYIYANHLHEYDNARTEYEKFLQRYPTHELADDVQWELKNLGKDLSDIELFPSESANNGQKQ